MSIHPSGRIGQVSRAILLALAAGALIAPATGCAQTAPPAPAPHATAAPRDARPMRLDFAQVDLRVLLGIVADAAGKKLRLEPGIGGTVDAHYAGPWGQVLAQIAQRHGLKAVIQGDEIHVSKAPI